MNKAQFVAFEGGEGAGKSTAATALYDALISEGVAAVWTREPGGSPQAEKIRELFKSQQPQERFTADSELLLVYAARIQHIQDTILPALQAGKVVICDRFEISSLAYQIYANNGDLKLFDMLHGLVVKNLKAVSATFSYIYFDIDPEVGLERIKKRQAPAVDTKDLYDTAPMDFHNRVRKGMEEARKHIDPLFTIHTIDATQDPGEVLKNIRTVLDL